MKNNNAAKIISFALASISLAICLFLWGQINGFEQGYVSGVFQEYPHETKGVIAHGPNFFESVTQWYFFITINFGIYIISKLSKSVVLSSGVCILSLLIISTQFWQMLSYKNEVLSLESKLAYDYWLNTSIYFDWFCLCVTVILMVMEVTLIITRKLEANTFKIN